MELLVKYCTDLVVLPQFLNNLMKAKENVCESVLIKGPYCSNILMEKGNAIQKKRLNYLSVLSPFPLIFPILLPTEFYMPIVPHLVFRLARD